jgi:hypothetical protein
MLICGKAFAFILRTNYLFYSSTFVVFLVFYFGNSLLNPIIAIGLKSLVALTYVYLNYKFVLSSLKLITGWMVCY